MFFYFFPFYQNKETIPSTFYKFVKDDDGHKALKSICEGFVKFSRITDMNDSSEECAFANYEEYCKTVRKIFNEGCSQDDFQMLSKHYDLIDKIFPELKMKDRKNFFMQWARVLCGKDLPSIIGGRIDTQLIQNADFFDNLENLFKLVHKNILNKVGAFCVTSLLDNYPMWTHYADYAQGFAVEFKNLHQRFNGDGTGILHQLDAVHYFDERKSTPTKPSDLSEIFRTKLTDWKHEKEYRIVECLSECEKGDKSQYFYPVGREYISRIIVGWKCSDVRFKEIKRITDEAGIEVIRLKIDEHGKIVPA
ncbi:MAG: DUF2971 domain-containing protein [Fibrobacter sp.]|nr:DUF2971 domain-containing protein [Fibrobacter sp.]